jgi:hypothetical protein
MGHFSEQAWADFTRGLDPSSNARGIGAHIAAGCLECKVNRGFWGRLQSMGIAEGAYAPPENLVRLAKLGFAPKQKIQYHGWTTARLLFSSLSGLQPAGIRGNRTPPCQLVYDAEGLTVDLRLDRQARPGEFSITGQILDRKVPLEPASGAVVVLWTEEGYLVATATPNEFGEFHFESALLDRVQLTARVGRRKVHIPLANFK